MTSLQAYEQMVTIRLFEEAIERLFLEGRITGTAHTCIGQEAVAVGVAAALQPHDAITSTHRGHGHFIARGADPRRVMAELFGREAGYSRGRGGSQMMMDSSLGFYGANGITGGSIPFAAGLALDAQLKKSGRVTACLFGDGASNQGVFHETLNLASLWKLPIIFIVENNGYAMSTSTARGLANPCIADRAQAYTMPGVTVDGNDFVAVRDHVKQFVEAARKGSGPALLECKTYRISGHSRGDPRAYRSRDEELSAQKHDPILRMESYLTKQEALPITTLVAHQKQAHTLIDEAIRFCETAPLPDPLDYLAEVLS
jgi:pyruvate dehydrogenase E1 component alpha subunit